MKKLLLTILIFYAIGCAPTGIYINPIVVHPTIETPSDVTIAILNTSVIGNPNLLLNSSTADQFAIDLKNIGFKVVDRIFVESWLLENNIDINQEITISIMKNLQSNLGVDAILKTTQTYKYIPARSSYSSTSKLVSDETDNNTSVTVNIDTEKKTRFTNTDYNKDLYNKPKATSSSKTTSTSHSEYYKLNSTTFKLVDALNNLILIDAISNYDPFNKSHVGSQYGPVNRASRGIPSFSERGYIIDHIEYHFQIKNLPKQIN